MKKDDKVILVNRSGRIIALNLPHEVYCAGAGACFCRVATLRTVAQDRTTGKRFAKPLRRRLCRAITLLPSGPGSQSPALHPAVLKCPEVEAALKTRPRRLTVRKVADGQ